ncbi:MAG: FixH family protein [Desulfobulbaceae bacterium]|nr:FixH family protein [Desulfobulbaceae bacterium]
MKKILVVIYVIFIGFVAGYSVFATKTFDGAVKHSYRKGMEYPVKLARLKELGWHFQSGPGKVVTGIPVELMLAITDNNGKPVQNMSVTFEVSRPAGPDCLRPMNAQEHEAGRYMAEMTIPQYGHWQIIANIHFNKEEFNHTFRIYAEKGESDNEA